MRTRKILKICIISLLFLSILSVSTNAYAIGNVINSGKSFLGAAKDIGFGINGAKLPDASKDLYNILLGVGVVVTLVISVFLGAKFIMASAEEKAEIKQSMLPFIIGTFVTFAAFGIWRIMVNMLSSLE